MSTAPSEQTYDPADPTGWSMGYIQQTGMTQRHFELFQKLAKDSGYILVVRNTNVQGIPLIEQGCPGKPKELEFVNTSESTGIVTTADPIKIERLRKLGYFVVEAGGKVAKRIKDGKPEILLLRGAFWKVEPGQVIDPTTMKPVVGDYDFMDFIDPKNPGALHAVVLEGGQPSKNITNPEFESLREWANQLMQQERVNHGPQSFYTGYRGGATAFFPNKVALYMRDEDQVRHFNAFIGRKIRERSTQANSLLASGRRRIRTISGRNLVRLGRKLAQGRVGGGILRSEDAMEFVAVLLGDIAQWIGDAAIRSRVENELKTDHAMEIAEILARGEGALVIIHLQEGAMAWETGHAARSLLGVYVHAGPNQNTALATWTDAMRHNKILTEVKDWNARDYEQHVWIDPYL